MRYSYMEDSYLKELKTKVISVKDDKFAVLENTIFYPNGGGQPHDTGKLIRVSDKKEFSVVFVGKFEGNISHEISEPGLNVGDVVKCVIDWDRRYYMMRAHTSAHLVCATFHNLAGALITGNQISEDKVRIDFNLENYDIEKLKEYIEIANSKILEKISVETSYLPMEEAKKESILFKLANALPPNVPELRIITIPRVDRQADGGTHVKNTFEVGKIEFLKSDNKGKNNRRVYYKIN